MVYRNIEKSVYGLKPVECYAFTGGFGNTWRYTSADQTISLDGNDYSPIPINRTEISQTQEVNKSNIKLEFPKSNALALQVLLNTSDEIITLTIYRFHHEDDDFVYSWKGRVTGAEKVSPSAGITLVCESIFSSLRRKGVRERFTILCGVPIYSTKCGLDKDDWDTSCTVSAIADDLINLTLDDASSEEDGYFTGGMARFGSDPAYTWRYIMSHAGQAVKISRPVYGLEVSDPVVIYPGCSRSIEICIDKFDNLTNFRGCPWIPDRNPFNGSSIV